MQVAERSTNAAHAMRVKSVAQASASMQAGGWDYLYERIKKSLTIPAYIVMIKV